MTTRKEFRDKWPLVVEGIGTDLIVELKRNCPVDTGRLKNSIKKNVKGNIILISMMDYALYVEFGTAPHIIRPVNAKALHWKQRGTGPRGGATVDDVFAKVVYHPGTAPQPFIRNTLRTQLGRIIKNNLVRQYNG